MPKVSMQFDCPEENDELMTALHGIDYKILLAEVAQWLRNAQKYGHEFKNPDEVITYLRELIFEGCRDRNVDVY
jgi:hypothetical protein